jgi:hypothetical protein
VIDSMTYQARIPEGQEVVQIENTKGREFSSLL